MTRPPPTTAQRLDKLEPENGPLVGLGSAIVSFADVLELQWETSWRQRRSKVARGWDGWATFYFCFPCKVVTSSLLVARSSG